MEVILLERVEKLGKIGDTVTVKDGYARNFLIPNKKALRATKDNVAYFEAERAKIEAENEQRRKDAEAIAAKLDGLIATLIRQASEDGRLYGSVSARDIADSVAETASEVSHKHVRLNDAIKYTGIYTVTLGLHPEVNCDIKINIARSQSEAKEALEASKKPAKPAKDEVKAEDTANSADNLESEKAESAAAATDDSDTSEADGKTADAA